MTGQGRVGGGLLCRIAGVLLAVMVLLSTVVGATAQEGASAEGGASGLNEMLAHVPAELPELEAPEQAYLAYADIATQLAAVGVDAPASTDDEGIERWSRATGSLAMPSFASSSFGEFREAFGFDLLQADQTLEISQLPFSLTFYRGQFDEEAVTEAMAKIGYRPGGVEGRRVLSRGDTSNFPDDGPAGYAPESMNYMTILDDGTLVFATERSIIAATIAVDNGEAPSLTEDESTAALLTHAPDDLATALLVPGQMLTGALMPGFDSTETGTSSDSDTSGTAQTELSQVPQISLALLGETIGGPLQPNPEETPESLPEDAPAARAFIALLMEGPTEAEDAVTVVEKRLATGSAALTQESYADLFPDPTVTAVQDEGVVLIELPYGSASRGVLLNMFYTRDLSFIGWG